MRLYFLICIAFINFSLKAQISDTIPPGTVPLVEGIYIDKAPVDNKMYNEFTDAVLKLWSFKLHDSLKKLKITDINKSLLLKPLDPLQSIEIYNKIALNQETQISDKVSMEYYISYPGYSNHPVINVSKKQAELFCKWRSDMVNLLWSTKIKSNETEYGKVKYRLPSEDEYNLAKKTFFDRGKLLLIGEESPLKIDIEGREKKDYLIFYNAPEFTTSDEKFKSNSFKVKNMSASEKPYTFFRCICELQ